MRVAHRDPNLERLEFDAGFDNGLAAAIVSSFRRKMQAIRAATDERTFYALKSLHFEKLKGERQQQHSMRLNDQFRLVVELKGTGVDRHIAIVSIEKHYR
jgi:toxin HigB-1